MSQVWNSYFMGKARPSRSPREHSVLVGRPEVESCKPDLNVDEI